VEVSVELMMLSFVPTNHYVKTQFSHFSYIKFFVQNDSLETQRHLRFNNHTSLIRHCCVTIKDESFQYHSVHFYCKLLANHHQRLNALIEFCHLIPDNSLLLLSASSLALKLNRKDDWWKLINNSLFEKNVRPVDEKFWIM